MIHLFPQQILLLYFSSQRIWILPIPLHFFLLPAVVAICLLRLLCVEVRDDDSSFVLIPFIFSPLRQHLGRWHRHQASRADGTVAADHFHRLLAANAPAAGTIVERRGRPLAPLAQATSYADPSVARPPPTPPPPASSAWRMAPSPLPASSACRTADDTHAVRANCRPPSRLHRANCRPRPQPPAPAGWRPRPCLRRADCRPPAAASLQTRTPFPTPAPSPKQLMQLLLRFFYSSSVLSIFSSSSVLPPRLPACCSHECSTIGCCAGLVFISAYRSPSVSSASSRDIFLPLFLFVQSL